MNLFSNVPPNTGNIDPYRTLNDQFNNGDPAAGPAFTNGGGTATYTPFGTPQASAEMLGAASDFFGMTCGVGRMPFQQSDAALSPSNLDAAGVINVREVSQPEAYVLSVACALISGKTLADVAIIGLQFNYSAATGNLAASFNLVDFNGNEIAKTDASSRFRQSLGIFNGELLLRQVPAPAGTRPWRCQNRPVGP